MVTRVTVFVIFLHLTRADFYIVPPTSWWDAREQGCKKNGSLFAPRELSTLANELPSLNSTEFYWMGAFHAYDPWIWTEDQSPLFEYFGTIATSDVSFKSQYRINGIDAYSCNVKCNDTTILIGLKGRTCYCLTQVNNNKFLPHGDVSQCSGNFVEFCGGSGKISVYKRSFSKSSNLNVTLKADRFGLCAFVSVVREGQLRVETDSNCTARRGVVYPNPTKKAVKLFGKMYVLSVYAEILTIPYVTASARYQLVQITRDNSEDVYRATRRTKTYWIGLSRDQGWRWTNGRLLSEEDVNGLRLTNTSKGLACLAVQKTERGVRFKTENCDTSFRAICYTPDSEREPFPLLIVVYAAGSGVVVAVVLVLVLIAYKRQVFCFRKNLKAFDEAERPLSNTTSRNKSDVINSQTETRETESESKDDDYEDHIYEAGETKDPVYTQVIKNRRNTREGDYDVADIENRPIRAKQAEYKNGENQNSYDHIRLQDSAHYDVAITTNSQHGISGAGIVQNNETYDHINNGSY